MRKICTKPIYVSFCLISCTLFSRRLVLLLLWIKFNNLSGNSMLFSILKAIFFICFLYILYLVFRRISTHNIWECYWNFLYRKQFSQKRKFGRLSIQLFYCLIWLILAEYCPEDNSNRECLTVLVANCHKKCKFFI